MWKGRTDIMKKFEFNEETVEGGRFENIEYKNELLEEIQFINTSFEKSDFSGTEFSNVEFDEIEAKEVNFEKCKMWSEQLTFKGNFEKCSWQAAEILDEDIKYKSENLDYEYGARVIEKCNEKVIKMK